MFGISIHAPIVGCDTRLYQSVSTWRYFNPRTHRGVRHQCSEHSKQQVMISIHAPIVGCDHFLRCLCKRLHISIHAPIVGCDYVDFEKKEYHKDFNPRTHRGVRQKLNKNSFKTRQFQSTHPSWGATSIFGRF
mgnify:FL=1